METNYQKTYNQAVRYISLRSHTEHELRTKLMRKKFDKSEVDQVLTDLKDNKYINDDDFAQVFAQNLIKYKSFGFFGIKMKLKQRGVADKTIERVLNEELDLITETKIAQRAISKKQYDNKLKLMQMLQRKGFRNQVIAQVVGDFDEV